MQPEKTIWTEGILLSQQHLQQRDYYYEQLLYERFKDLAPLNWGVKQIDVDEDSLRYGQYRISQCQLIFPDGFLLNYNSQQEKSLSCQLNGKQGETIDVYLCMPNNKLVAGINGYPSVEKEVAAWHADYRQVTDFFDSNRQSEVVFAKPTFMLICGNQIALNQCHHHYIKLSEIIYKGNNSYQMNDNYIPPLTNLQASKILTCLLNRTIDLLAAKIKIIQERRQRLWKAKIEYFLLLQILLNSFSQLKHCSYLITHPEKFFSVLIKLISSLGSLIDSFRLDELPEYQHTNLGSTFLRLDQLVRQYVEDAMPVQSAEIQLHRESDTNYVVDNIDRILFDKNQFYLAVSQESDNLDWIDQFTRQIKIASQQSIDDVLTSALSGVKVTHLQRPPIKLPMKSGYEYFYLEPFGEFWQRVIKDRSLAIFLSQKFYQAKIELILIEE